MSLLVVYLESVLSLINTAFEGLKKLYGHLSRVQRTVIVVTLAMMLMALVLPSSNQAPPGMTRVSLPLSLDDPEFQGFSAEKSEDDEPKGHLYYVVAKGDTLSKIFENLGVPQATLYQLLEADVNVLALDTIQPGHRLEFQFDEQERLTRFTFRSGITYMVDFTRGKKDDFEFVEHIEKGQHRSEVFVGTVQGNLHLSMKKAGTSLAEAYTVSNVLKTRMNFRKDLRAGDQFQLAISRQYVKGQYTGNSKIEGFRYLGKRRTLEIYNFDGNFFDEKGRSLEKAFQRIPLKKRYRISSNFNPRRRHPVTRAIRPHNGTDFATPMGTPVLAAGDGVVTRVIRHRYAGLYIQIQHGRKYRTRYLHLKKAYVRKGQKVSRGQKIALSGNSGRSTGPHLHYEFHINNRPVNAMKARIPEVKTIASKHRKKFKVMVKTLTARMQAFAKSQQNELQQAQRDAG